MKPVAYEGTEPYIFVSYSHKDAEAIYEVLNELQARGYRFWYDDGIAPGSEWPEDIARHLDAAYVVVAFVTPQSMLSQNCRREINFSLSREKRFLSVIMEPTEMPLGMEMQLSAQQSIVRYNFDSWDGFVHKLVSCPDLAPCLRASAPEPSEVSAGVAVADAHAEADPDSSELARPSSNQKQFDTKDAVAPIVAPDPVPSAEPLVVSQAKVDPHQPADSHPAQTTAAKRKLALPLIIGGVVAALALVFALVRIFGGAGDYTTSWGATIEKDATSFSAYGRALTQDDVEAIASLEGLSYIILDGCDLTACDLANLHIASSGLSSVNLNGTTGLDSFGFLEGLPLTKLTLSGASDFSDLSALSLEKLRYLYIDGTSVSDLSPLSVASDLEELDFSGTAIADLSALADLANLRKVIGAGTQVSTLDALSGLEKLTYIDFVGCPLTSLCDSAGTMAALALDTVRLRDTEISDLSPLANCTRLKILNLYGCAHVTDLSWLNSQNYATLEYLHLGRSGISGDSLDWIAQCTGLKSLTLDGIALSDIDFCSTLTGLTYLSAQNCGLADIGPLASCTELETILLNHNALTDVSPLADLSSIGSDTILDLSHNSLASVSSLPAGKYRAIMLYGNPTGVGATLPAAVEAYEVVVPWYDSITTSVLASNRSKYSCIYLVGCPQDQVLAVQDALGSTRVKLVSESELWQVYRDGFDYALDVNWSYFLSLV